MKNALIMIKKSKAGHDEAEEEILGQLEEAALIIRYFGNLLD